MFRYIIIAIAALVTGAHFMRGGEYGLMAVSLTAPFLLFKKELWAVRIMQILLLLSSLIWLESSIEFISIRKAMMMPYTRLGVIMGSVVLWMGLSALLLESKYIKERYRDKSGNTAILAAVFSLTALTLGIVHLKVPLTMLLIERFFPGWGWVEIFAISLYAVFVAGKMLDASQSALWRRRIWTGFSIVFFGQLLLGLTGFDRFLMTGQLHLPVPAVIVAGPLFRGEGFFMLILFLSTVVLIGPAWCSHICYIGSWDGVAAQKRRTPKVLPVWRKSVRWIILAAVISVTIFLRIIGVPILIATIIGGIFGLAGVAVMLIWSRKAGSMTHCTTYCPIGPLATTLGKINPFRIRINDACDECGKCRLRCRYDALNKEDIIRRKPDMSCTLCGDCITSCPHNALEYGFLKIKPENARKLFLVLVISLHACTMALARI